MASSKKPSVDLDIRGWSGLRQQGGRITEEWHRALRGPRGRLLLQEMMDNDPVIGAVMTGLCTFVRQADVIVRKGPSEDVPAAENEEFVGECLEDMSSPLDDVIAEVMRYVIGQGFAVAEEVYKIRGGYVPDKRRRSKYSDGLIGWRNWGIRPPTTIDRWVFDPDDDEPIAFEQIGDMGERYTVPLAKCLHWRSESASANPEGRSMLRNSVTSYMAAKNLREVEAIGIERDMTGLPILEVPREILSKTASSEHATLRTNLETKLAQIKRDERAYMLLPAELDADGKRSGFKFRLEASPGTHSVDTDVVIRRYESRMAMPLLAEIMFQGVDAGAGLGGGLGEVKLKMFERSVEALLERICAPINADAIPRLMMLNGRSDPATWPYVTFGPVSKPKLVELADFLSKTITSGALVPDESIDRHVREEGGLPDREDEYLPTGAVQQMDPDREDPAQVEED